jgi:hypothetical protein
VVKFVNDLLLLVKVGQSSDMYDVLSDREVVPLGMLGLNGTPMSDENVMFVELAERLIHV